jgi:hypothetical protein
MWVGRWRSGFLRDTADHKSVDVTLSMTVHPRWQVEETLGFKAPRHLPTEYEDVRLVVRTPNKQESLNHMVSKSHESQRKLRMDFKNSKHVNLRIIELPNTENRDDD